MPSRAARVALPAKLTPPQLQGMLPRDRLFTWLDHHANAGAVWISGAPGAGKTVLAASWVDARGWPRVWYRLDTDDNDLGRFFTLLGLAVDRLGAPQRPPVFAAEHMARPEAFARLWFRHVFTGLSRPLALVLDNLEQARLPALPGLLAAAIAEALPGVRLIVTCRHDPPPELAPCTLTGMLVALPPTALRFNGDEALSLARQLGLDAAAVGAAVQRVQGWAAGLRLLAGTSQAPPETASQQVLFDYFAGLLHDRLNPADQRVLLAAALLPWVPAPLLAEVSGEATAPALLEMLAAQHLFTERLQSGNYRLHPLFRGFLKQRAAQSLAAAERLSLLRRAAAAFAASGDSDTAIDLLLDAGDTADATALLVPSIEARLAAGQLEQVAAWCRCPGETALDVAPWLRYGLARACFLREDAAALHHYARAAGHFAASGESTGERLCAAGLLEYRYNADSFDDHVRWCAVLRRPSSDEPAAIEYRLRLLNGRLLACYYGGDFEHEGGALVEAVLDALVPGAAENEKLSAGITLLGLLERHKRWEAAHLLAGRMEALLTSPRVGPRLAILVRQQIAADLHRQSGAYVAARRLALQSRDLAREHGFAVLHYKAVAVLTLVALFTGDEAAARDLLAELATLSDPGSVYHQRFGHVMRAWHALQGGRSASAREHADALRTAVARSDMPARLRATWLQHAMLVRFATGDADGALAELDAAALAAEPGSRETLQVNRLALQAWRAHGNGDRAAAIAALQRSWELAEPIRCYQVLPPLREALSALAGLALQHDIAPASRAS